MGSKLNYGKVGDVRKKAEKELRARNETLLQQ